MGSQTDLRTATDFHVSHAASLVATGGIWWAKPTQARNQLGSPGGAKSSLRGAHIFLIGPGLDLPMHLRLDCIVTSMGQKSFSMAEVDVMYEGEW